MYDYQTQRPKLFDEMGVKYLVALSRAIEKLPKRFIRIDVMELKALPNPGDSWVQMAALDYLAEIGLVRFVQKGHVGQYDLYEQV